MRTNEEVEVLVGRYIGGDDEALEELLDAFDPYLTKWFNILRCHHINTLDTEVQGFVLLFGVDDLITLRHLLRRALQPLSDGDIRDRVTELFILRAAKYEDMGRNFVSYLKTTMKYSVFHWVRTLISNTRVIYDSDYIDRETVEPQQDAAMDAMDLEAAMRELTGAERRYMHLRYVEDMSNTRIAELHGITPTRVSIIISGAKAKLREYLTS